MARLRIAQVEYKVCRCGTEYEGDRCPGRPDQEPSDTTTVRKVCPCCGTEYEGDQCPGCRGQQPFVPTTMRKVAYDHLIVVDVAPEPYKRAPRLRCKQRGAHYQRLNGGQPPDRLSEKWENLYDIDDVRSYDDLQENRELLKDPPLLKHQAKTRRMPVEQLTEDLEALCTQLKERVFRKLCPLCGGKPSNLPSHVWVRTFAEIAPAKVLAGLGTDDQDDDGPDDQDDDGGPDDQDDDGN